jgi:large subunit ribosomal protein L29
MPLSKIEEARNLNEQELGEQILAVKRQLFELRMQKATRQLEKSHQFKHTRHWLAQLMTVERERQRAATASEETAEPATTSTSPSAQSIAEEE